MDVTALLHAVMVWLVALIPIAVLSMSIEAKASGMRGKVAKWAVIAAATLCMVGCGGGSGSGNDPVLVASDPQLVAMWGRAQQHLATVNIVLNAAVVKTTPGTLPDTVPPDPRALNVGDEEVTVTPVPDLTVAELKAENPGITLRHKSDPTGVIHGPSGGYCASYLSGTSIYVAKSLEYSDHATGYEMQNIILERLGYDISGR